MSEEGFVPRMLTKTEIAILNAVFTLETERDATEEENREMIEIEDLKTRRVVDLRYGGERPHFHNLFVTVVKEKYRSPEAVLNMSLGDQNLVDSFYYEAHNIVVSRIESQLEEQEARIARQRREIRMIATKHLAGEYTGL